jgi:hypothetical protein
MSTAPRRCLRCGAELAADQEFCLDCGAAQTSPATPHWRRPLVAAAVTLLLTVLVLVFGYERMRENADDTAASQPAAAVKQAGASGPAASRGRPQPAQAAHLAARSSP